MTVSILTGSPLPSGRRGEPYVVDLIASGNPAHEVWSILTGSVPGVVVAGQQLVATSLSMAGLFEVDVQVVDSDLGTTHKVFQIIVDGSDTTDEEIALRARAILTDKPVSVHLPIPRLIALIPIAIANCFTRAKEAGESLNRFQATTDAITIGALSRVDIAAALAAKRISLDVVKASDITINSDPGTSAAFAPTVEFVNSLDRLVMGSELDGFMTLAYLDGSMLFFDPARTTLVGKTFTINAVALPANVSDLSDLSLIPELAMELAAIVQAQEESNARGVALSEQKV